jgi:hypothetical protein
LISTNSTEAASEDISNSISDVDDLESQTSSQEIKKKSLYQRAKSIGSSKSRSGNSNSKQSDK